MQANIFLSLLVFFDISTNHLIAQKSLWKPVTTSKGDLQHTLKRPAEEVKTYILNESLLKELLRPALADRNALKNSKVVVDFPDTEGNFTTYKVIKASTLSPGLAKKYPELKSYIGQAVNDPSKTVRFSTSPYTGLYVLLSNTIGETSYILRGKSKKSYSFYRGKDIQREVRKRDCNIEENELLKNDLGQNPEQQKGIVERTNFDTGVLKTYRLTLATSGEMSYFILRGLEISNDASEEEKKSAIISWLSQVILVKTNAIFERDLGIQFQLAENNDANISLDVNDALYNLNKYEVLGKLRDESFTQIQFSGSDILHILIQEGPIASGGVATLYSICSDRSRGGGVTSFKFEIDPYIVAPYHKHNNFIYSYFTSKKGDS